MSSHQNTSIWDSGALLLLKHVDESSFGFAKLYNYYTNSVELLYLLTLSPYRVLDFKHEGSNNKRAVFEAI